MEWGVREHALVTPERLLRFAALYHGLLGGIAGLLPADLFGYLGVEQPRWWLFYYLSVAGLLVLAGACEVARRRLDLRKGLVFGVLLSNLAGGAVVVIAVVWSDLPQVLLGSGAAAGLWAWLLWDVYSPENSPSAEPPPSEEPEQG